MVTGWAMRYSNSSPSSPAEALAHEFQQGALTADQLLARYCAYVYGQTGSYEETARRLGLDRRTVKAKAALAQ